MFDKVCDVRCVENKCCNSNFTKDGNYKVNKRGSDYYITCNFIHLKLPDTFTLEDSEFEFAFCKFLIHK